MGRGDSRNSPKMRRRKAQVRLKLRIKRRRVAAAAVRAQNKPQGTHAVKPAAQAAAPTGAVKQREKKPAPDKA